MAVYGATPIAERAERAGFDLIVPLDNHEVLITARRRAKGDRRETQIVALRRMPQTTGEAAELAGRIEKGAGIGELGAHPPHRPGNDRSR